MKIVFTLNQVRQIQINSARRTEVYDLVRSYLGIPVGKRFDNFDLIDILSGNTFIKYQKDTDACTDDNDCFISVRGNEFCLPTVLHAVHTEIAMQNIGTALNHVKNGLISASQLSKVVKHAKSMIDMTEW